MRGGRSLREGNLRGERSVSCAVLRWESGLLVSLVGLFGSAYTWLVGYLLLLCVF